MSNLLNLIKTNLIEHLKINKFLKRKNIILKILGVLIMLVGLAFIYGYIGMILYQIALPLGNYYGPNFVLSAGLISSAVMLIITSISRANSFLFKSKDFDLIMSLPLKTNTVVFAKILSFVLLSYLTMSFTFIPSIVVYSLITDVMPLFYVFAVIIFIFFPLLIVTVFSFISYLLAVIFANFRYKNLIAIIFSLALFIIIFVISYSSNGGNADIFIALDNNLKMLYYPGYLAKNALLGDTINLILFLIISIIPFSVFIIITGKNYIKINTRLNQNAKSKKFEYNVVKQSQSGVITSIFKNEIKRILSIPIYAINTISTKLIMPIVVYFMYTQIAKSLEGADQIDSTFLVLIITALMLFFIGSASITSVSISMEGKQLWILKSSPISFKNIAIAKSLPEIITSIFFSSITVIVVGVLLKPSAILIVGLLLLMFVFSIHNAFFGLIINLIFPKMEWDLPVKVVKQSLSVFINMIANMIIVGLVIYLGVKLTVVFENFAYLLFIGAALFLAILIIDIVVLSKFGAKRFKRL